MPSVFAASMIGSKRSIDSAMEQFRLALENPSEAEANTAISSARAAFAPA